jgi:pilus assembly protein Flp/PilA
MRRLRRLLLDERAATAVEYAVMMGMILLVIIGAIGTVGTQTSAVWTKILNNLTSVVFGH